MNPLAVGDRVSTRGWLSRQESDRVGTVVELYRGVPSALDKGVELVAVCWDDNGRTERGYILASGSLTKIPSDPTPIGEA
jgi:hypothetical protein